MIAINTIRVMLVKDRKFLGDRWMPASDAADFVRTAQWHNAKLTGSGTESG